MDCVVCGHQNRGDARFCSACGEPFLLRCRSCGRGLEQTAKFCDECGTATTPQPAPDDAVRKTVTVLFADLVGSTAFGELVDAESIRDVIARYHTVVRTVTESHGGVVAKFIGDGVMALFGVPATAEDDALRAIRAGVELQSRFESLRVSVADRHGTELGLRVGINTGEVVIAAGDNDIVGDALNVAARLEAACAPGEVLVGEDTWRLTRSWFDFQALDRIRVRGKATPLATYRVRSAELVAEDDQDTPFVGRTAELNRLGVLFDTALTQRVIQVAVIIGSPGVGKTRLSREFGKLVGDKATVVEVRCRRSGTETFAPVADLIRSAVRLGDADSREEVLGAVRSLVEDLHDADRVADLLSSFVGAGPDRSTEEAFFAVRRLVESQARDRPMVLVVDDIQWAEPLFLDLLEHLAEWTHDAPTVIVALARPEIRDVRPRLTTESRTVQATLALEGLDPMSTEELASRLVGGAVLPAELIGRIPPSTDGNPLFVRELMRMLVDDCVIVETDGAWELTIDAEAVDVPPTIQSLLSARLDRMEPDERRLLEVASVVGSEFPLGAFRSITDLGLDDVRLRDVLDRLRRRELVEATGRHWGDEPVFRFHHVLVRDAAYRRLLKSRRAQLHEQIGEWTERTANDLPGEHEVSIAFHFEQVYAYKQELSDLGEGTVAVGRRSAELLGIASRRALDRNDIAAAGALAERAVACLGHDDPARPELLMLGTEALLDLGAVARGCTLLDALDELAVEGHADPRQRAWTECFRAQREVLTEPGRLRGAMGRLQAAATALADLGDDAGVAKARLVRAGALARLGRIGESEYELDLALGAARAADDRRRVATVLGVAPAAALWGPSPIPRAGGRCLDVVRLLRITTGSPAVEAVSTRCQAVLEALRGRFDTARSMVAEARSTVEELGLRHEVLAAQLYAGIIELLAGEPTSAEPPLREAYTGLADLGIDADAGHAAAYLARALLRLGQLDEAGDLAAVSDALAGQTPQTGITARAVLAEVLAAQGHQDDAVELAREAVEMASATDLVVDHADANTVLAAVAPDPAEATAAREAAKLLYEGKAAHVSPSIIDAAATAADQGFERSTAGHHVTSPARRAPATGESWNLAVAVDDPAFDTTAQRLSQLIESAMNGGTLADQLAALYEPDFARIDHRTVIGTGTIDMSTYVDNVPDFFVGISHVPVARRGELLLLQRAKLRYDGDNESDLLVLSEFRESGRVRRTDLFDANALDDAMAELDRQWRQSLRSDERATLELARQFSRAFARQDNEAFDRILHPDFRVVEYQVFGGGEMDRAAWRAGHRQQDAVFGRRRLLVDVIELPSSQVVLARTHSLGRSPTDVDWAIEEWSVLQMRDGRVLRTEVFETHPRDRQYEVVRRRARELAATSRTG